MFYEFKANYDKSLIDEVANYLLTYKDAELISKNDILKMLRIPHKSKFLKELFITNTDRDYDLFVLQIFEELRTKLLTEYNRALVTARNGFYKFLKPSEQAQYFADKSTQSAINELQKGQRGIKFIDTMKLTHAEINQRRELMSRVSFVKNMIKTQTNKKNLFELEGSNKLHKKFVV